jgi:hypothetical protein
MQDLQRTCASALQPLLIVVPGLWFDLTGGRSLALYRAQRKIENRFLAPRWRYVRFRFRFFVLSVFLFAATAFTQDPIKVDPKHYKVEIDNPPVRVLRIHFGPHEKSVMHKHPAGGAVFLTENRSRFTMPDGKTVERDWKVGDAQWTPAETHLPENLSERPLDLVLIELKGK